MIKYKIRAIVICNSTFDRSAFDITVQNILDQSGIHKNSILCTVILPDEEKEDSTINKIYKNLCEIIYSSDIKEDLRQSLLRPKSEYVTICKAGDIYSQNAFASVYKIFSSVKGVCDVLGLYVKSELPEYIKYNEHFFEEEKLYHLLDNFKMYPINLKGLFIKSSVAAEKAKQQPKGFERIRFLIDILTRRNTFAVSGLNTFIDTTYNVQTKVAPDIFERCLVMLNKYISDNKGQGLPKYVQSIFLNQVMICLNNATDTVNKYDITYYDFGLLWDKLSFLLEKINDDVIINYSTSRFNKLFLLKIKYRKPCKFDLYYHDLKIVYEDRPLYKLSTFPVRLDLVNIENNKLIIEGYCQIPSCVDFDLYSVKGIVNGTVIDTEAIERYQDRYFYNKVYLREAGFKLELRLENQLYEITFADYINKNICIKNQLEFMNICCLNNEVEEDYFYKDGYIINCYNNTIVCVRCDERNRLRREEALQFAIRRYEPTYANEIIEIRNNYWDNYQHKTKQIWLITDRPDRADDNGEAFFRYMLSRNEKDIDLYFVLSKESAACEELSKIGKIIEPFSQEHKKLHLLADYVISSQMGEAVYNPFNDDVKYFRGLFRNPKHVFLQHGVINNEHGGRFFSKYGRDFYGFVVSANEEYNYMREPKFHYNDEIWLTGQPRWDFLCHDDKKKITIMPTWRKYLTTRVFDEAAGTKIWKVNDNFIESEYFKFYNNLLNDTQLLDAADRLGYKICFMPHVIFLKEAVKFKNNNRLIIYNYEKSYREIYAESSLVVTDYSSAVFDFAYMRLPIVYCQFDKEDFYNGHSYTKGYFDHERDGFGEVTYNLQDLVKLLINYMSDGCKLKPQYKKRIDDFFCFNDKNCCERVYKKIRGIKSTENNK